MALRSQAAFGTKHNDKGEKINCIGKPKIESGAKPVLWETCRNQEGDANREQWKSGNNGYDRSIK